MKSIIQEKKECYVCKMTLGLHSHHIFGAANRKKSEQHGLKVWLCGYHHNLSNMGVHFYKPLDIKLKRLAQEKYEETHTREEFMREFGRNYLD